MEHKNRMTCHFWNIFEHVYDEGLREDRQDRYGFEDLRGCELYPTIPEPRMDHLIFR